MAKITIHAGDFLGDGWFNFGVFSLQTKEHSFWQSEKIKASELELVEAASEENVKKLGGTIGWGAVGALALGPLGLLAGVLVGGRKKNVTFVAKFKDGRRLLATTDSKTFTTLQAAVF
jgi:hypothetical protein